MRQADHHARKGPDDRDIVLHEPYPAQEHVHWSACAENNDNAQHFDNDGYEGRYDDGGDEQNRPFGPHPRDDVGHRICDDEGDCNNDDRQNEVELERVKEERLGKCADIIANFATRCRADQSRGPRRSSSAEIHIECRAATPYRRRAAESKPIPNSPSSLSPCAGSPTPCGGRIIYVLIGRVSIRLRCRLLPR